MGVEQLRDDLAGLVQERASEAREMVRDSCRALSTRDLDLAQATITADDELDARCLQLHELLGSYLAGRRASKIDVRFVFAMLEITNHLERIGDYAVTIAKMTIVSQFTAGDVLVLRGLTATARQVDAMVDRAMHALASRDIVEAETLVEMDQKVNRANRKIVKQLLDLGADSQLREWGLQMIVVSRSLERIGDHAVDIGEQVSFLVTGQRREFTDASNHAPTPSPANRGQASSSPQTRNTSS